MGVNKIGYIAEVLATPHVIITELFLYAMSMGRVREWSKLNLAKPLLPTCISALSNLLSFKILNKQNYLSISIFGVRTVSWSQFFFYLTRCAGTTSTTDRPANFYKLMHVNIIIARALAALSARVLSTDVPRQDVSNSWSVQNIIQ